MKSYLIKTLIIALSIFGLTNMQAQNKTRSYVVMTTKVQQIKPILIAAEALKLEDGKHFGDFQIIICGKNVADVTDASKMNEFIATAKTMGVTINACGFSLNKFKVERSSLPESIPIVENGILHFLQLQKKGYLNLSL
ncbi:sulfur reduction protein DsrE [Xanthomarina sp. F1114]|uniref:sulfur reduction protein DsrE n=1 Tax=Xanthomarina sp. F1114 TaxID=2996019 RepID=UPI00225E06B1|nr:sulfur reduction protein DsrE [Xanthomarina sp. F1114]MCX7548300.1 sulfur reduction protein DsrE [Xanthomarina sp. F1114]